MNRTKVYLGIGAGVMLALPRVAMASENLYVGDLGQALAAAAIFALLLVVLGRFAWKPIIRQLRQRELQVASTLKRAAHAEAEADDLRQHYERKMSRAADEADRVVAQARQAATDEGEDILQAARARAQETVVETHRQIEQAQRDAMDELQETTIVLATDLAGKIVGQELDTPDAQDALFAQAINDIGQEARRRS
jgi:F-type H+-transporting ATPase subunit b